MRSMLLVPVASPKKGGLKLHRALENALDYVAHYFERFHLGSACSSTPGRYSGLATATTATQVKNNDRNVAEVATVAVAKRENHQVQANSSLLTLIEKGGLQKIATLLHRPYANTCDKTI
jgi:hypothetical protein